VRERQRMEKCVGVEREGGVCESEEEWNVENGIAERVNMKKVK
jgi:hypothetical protein